MHQNHPNMLTHVGSETDALPLVTSIPRHLSNAAHVRACSSTSVRMTQQEHRDIYTNRTAPMGKPLNFDERPDQKAKAAEEFEKRPNTSHAWLKGTNYISSYAVMTAHKPEMASIVKSLNEHGKEAKIAAKGGDPQLLREDWLTHKIISEYGAEFVPKDLTKLQPREGQRWDYMLKQRFLPAARARRVQRASEGPVVVQHSATATPQLPDVPEATAYAPEPPPLESSKGLDRMIQRLKTEEERLLQHRRTLPVSTKSLGPRSHKPRVPQHQQTSKEFLKQYFVTTGQHCNHSGGFSAVRPFVLTAGGRKILQGDRETFTHHPAW